MTLAPSTSLTLRRVLAYALIIPAAQVSMHKEWVEAGLESDEAWRRVYQEAMEWYIQSLCGMLGVVLLTVVLNKFGLFGGFGSVLLAGLGLGGALCAMRLVKWHKEIDQ